MNAIETRGLTKTFKGFTAVSGLNLSVPEGSVFGFLGRNGAGKTTTIRMLTGLSRPDSGEILIAGVPVRFGEKRPEACASGYLPDVPQFYEWMSAGEFLKLTGQLEQMEPEDIRLRSQELLHRVGLDAANRKIRGFSRGMRQRLGIAQALMARPRAVLMDEPTSALDPVGRREVMDIIAALRAETTVLFSTHILDDAQRICDHVAVMDHGKLMLSGAMEDVLTGRNIWTVRFEFLRKDKAEYALSLLQNGGYFAQSDPQGWVVSGKNESVFDALIQAATQSGAGLCRMERSEQCLEDVFMEVIHA